MGDDILTVTIASGGSSLSVTLSEHRVVVQHDAASPFSIGVPRQGEADAVATELRSLARDACLHDAISALALRFSAA